MATGVSNPGIIDRKDITSAAMAHKHTSGNNGMRVPAAGAFPDFQSIMIGFA